MGTGYQLGMRRARQQRAIPAKAKAAFGSQGAAAAGMKPESATAREATKAA
jgi:hypothetical protein